MIEFYEVDQNTDDWFLLRSGLLTMSKLGTVMAKYGQAFGDPAKKYAVELAIEQITGVPVPSEFQNSHMNRGHEQEPDARNRYESENFSNVAQGGFYCDETTGYSPDGRVGDEGLLEIKCVIPSIHYATVRRKSFDPAYKWQLIGALWLTEREWIDFVSYCPAFPEEKQLFTHRLNYSDFPDEFQMIDKRIAEFKKLVSETKLTILNSEYSI